MNTLNRHRLLVGIGFLILLGGVTYSCKDFLNAVPQGTLNQATLTNAAGVEGSLIAAYRALDCTNSTNSDWGCAASNWPFGSVPSDEAYKGSEASDQPGVTDLELYNWTTGSADDYLNTKWTAVYEGVFRSNATLRLLHRVRAEKPTEIDNATAQSIEGEAKFLRAHYMFEGMRMWGAVPYYYENDTTDFKKTNVGVNDTTLILADLDSAFVLLPDAPRNGEKGRVTRWTAKAYKGRVLAYRKDWAGVVRVLDSVVASTKYALETSFDRVWTGFKQFADGPETILAYQASANDGEPNGNNANYGERLNFPHSDSPFGCCGFHQPSQNLLNSFVVDANGLPKAVTTPTWNARNAFYVASINDTLDPRIDWTVGRDSVPFKDWGLHLPVWIRAPGYGGPYSPKKNIHEKASGAESKVGWATGQLNSVHIHIYRYADLLLLLAEAEVETNDLLGATALVNQVRARAGVTAQGCGSGVTAKAESILVARYPGCAADTRMVVPITDAVIKWATYKVGLYPTFPDQTFGRNAVRIERKIELAMEGQRFFDLRRWGIADTTITSFLAIESNRRSFLGAATPFAARYRLYPIPSLQIELSKVGGTSTLQQNPLW
jgi:hypothetical protein